MQHFPTDTLYLTFTISPRLSEEQKFFRDQSSKGLRPNCNYTWGHPKTAITTPFRLFKCLHLPYGLRNAAQTFQHFIDNMVRELPFIYTYLDDLALNNTPVEHEGHLRLIFERLTSCSISLNKFKCALEVPELNFLGHRVDQHDIQHLPGKVQSKTDSARLTSVRKLWEFLGFVNFYRCFIFNCAKIVQLLTDLL